MEANFEFENVVGVLGFSVAILHSRNDITSVAEVSKEVLVLCRIQVVPVVCGSLSVM